MSQGQNKRESFFFNLRNAKFLCIFQSKLKYQKQDDFILDIVYQKF